MIIKKATGRGARIRRSLAHSDYVTVAWTWFMILAGKAAEPVLVASVLYASVKLLPAVHFPPQFDVAVFIAQFVALDIGGLSLNKLADQAKKDGNEIGARQAKRLSIALVAVMLVGVIMAGLGQVVKLEGELAAVIDTILLVARAVLAVLYSRVIHSLRDDEPEWGQVYSDEEIKSLIFEATGDVVAETVEVLRQEVTTYIQANLSQLLEERLTMLDLKQAEAMIRFKEEQTSAISETTETIKATIETTLRKRTAHETRNLSADPQVRSVVETAAPQRQRDGKREIDDVVWPLLNSGMSVRAIAAQANTSTATVGRSRQRWLALQAPAQG